MSMLLDPVICFTGCIDGINVDGGVGQICCSTSLRSLHPKPLHQRNPSIGILGRGLQHGRRWSAWRSFSDEAAKEGTCNLTPTPRSPHRRPEQLKALK